MTEHKPHKLPFKGRGEYVQSVCTCGHYQQAHRWRDGTLGHGPCTGCECAQFTWHSFAEYLAQRPPLENAPR